MASPAFVGPPAPEPTQQFGRKFQLLVSNSQGQALDFSQLRVKFSIKKSSIQTPNVADILIYNLSDVTAAILAKQEFTRVVLSGGYAGNFGVLFKGNVKQVIVGRESATDTFVNLVCGDGEQAYNFAVVNTTVGSSSSGGASPSNQLAAVTQSLNAQGIGNTFIAPLPQVKLPRGKVMYGNSRDYFKTIADTNGFVWSIQDEGIIALSEKTYLPNQVVVLTSKTGLVGTPQQTTTGVNCKCLINPGLRVHGRVQIDNRSVEQFKIDFTSPGSPANTPSSLATDGMYYVLVNEIQGDTRGIEWYNSLQLLTIDISSNPLNSVQVGSGV